MKKVTFSCLTLATLLQLIPSNGNAANIQVNKKKTNRTEMKQDTIPANSTKKESEEGERNVMLNASDANKPREIQIGLTFFLLGEWTSCRIFLYRSQTCRSLA